MEITSPMSLMAGLLTAIIVQIHPPKKLNVALFLTTSFQCLEAYPAHRRLVYSEAKSSNEWNTVDIKEYIVMNGTLKR